MGIVQTLVTVAGVIAIIGLLALLFCHYLGGWTWTKAWLRSSGEEKMVLTRAGTHRHFNPNGYMISSDSDLNLSGRGSFRRFDTTDNDYQLFRQGSCASLTRQHNTQGPNIPPQPLRPAPIPPSVTAAGSQLTSQSSLDSVFNTAPSSPAPSFGPVPRIPPPPQHTGSSSSSHASPRSTMGDANGRGGGGGGSGNNSGNGGGASGVSNLSSTNPFLPLLQASTQFFSQTIQSFQSGLQQPQGGNITTTAVASEDSHNAGSISQTAAIESSSSHYSTSTTEDPVTAQSRSTVGSATSSISTVPPGSAGLSMGELLFSAPPVYQSKDLEPRLQLSSIFGGPTPQSAVAERTNQTSTFGPFPVTSTEALGSSYQAKHTSTMSSSRPIGPRNSTGSPQHTRYNIYHQNSAENLVGTGNLQHHGGGGGGGIVPSAHSPPPGTGHGIRRASYPNRKEYMPHDTIPKSEFPQHIPYIPSPHHHHHHHHPKGGGVGERKGSGGSEPVVGFNDPLRHHHYLPPLSSTPVQPFLEEQEEPPEEPCTHHQLPNISNSNLEMEREDLKNRIMLETMREEIRIANERMADVTKSLMMDDVFLPGSPSSSVNNTNGDGDNSHHADSPKKKRLLTGNLSSSSTEETSASKGKAGVVDDNMTRSRHASTTSASTLTFTGSSYATSSTTSSATTAARGEEVLTTTSGKHSALTSSGPPSLPHIYNNQQAVGLSSSTGSSSSSFSRNEIQTGTQNNSIELCGNDVKNGYGNGGTTTAISNNCSSNTVETSTTTAGSQNRTGNHILPQTSFGGGVVSQTDLSQNTQSAGVESNSITMATLMNALIMSSSGSGSNAASGRPPTVSSYFKQNSRSFSLRQSSIDSIGSDSDLSSPTDGSSPSLQRAMSCDSVCSDTSVILGDLDPPHMTGHLCIGLEYDSETADLLVNVMEAKELVGPDPDPNAPFDSYVRVYLLPDKTTNMQTRVYRKSLCPVYKEKFMFGLEMTELAHRSLVFYLYGTDKYTNTLIGEAELKLGDMELTQPVVTWLLLTDTGQRGGEFGEIMFSLSYLPTAERLTVVVVKARNLKFPQDKDNGDPFVKVYLLQRGKKVSKKKSSTKRGEKNPIFNEAMIFSIPAHALQTIQLRITVADSQEAEGRAYSIGHVIVGSVATGKPLSHWNQMLSSLRKPIAMWHALRK